jgi:hypothetical protein
MMAYLSATHRRRAGYGPGSAAAKLTTASMTVACTTQPVPLPPVAKLCAPRMAQRTAATIATVVSTSSHPSCRAAAISLRGRGLRYLPLPLPLFRVGITAVAVTDVTDMAPLPFSMLFVMAKNARFRCDALIAITNCTESL